MARELEPERGVPSEPSAELIPFLFGVVTRAVSSQFTVQEALAAESLF